MQGRCNGISNCAESTSLVASVGLSSRHDSTSKLLETAVKMIKNGVGPDVITFVDSTKQEIDEQVLVAIQNEHGRTVSYATLRDHGGAAGRCPD